MNLAADALHTLLRNNIVAFTFRKVNGEVRHAVGTRNLDIARNHTGEYIPNPKGDEQPNSYYDIEVMGWRSYKPENVISIDGVVARTDTDFAKKPTLLNEPPKETKKGELPKREIPVSKPTENGGADISKFLGGLFGVPMGEIRKSMEDLDKDIVIGAPAHSPKVGTPKDMMGDVTIPIAPLGGKGGVSVDEFAKLVAHYVVDELVNRLK